MSTPNSEARYSPKRPYRFTAERRAVYLDELRKGCPRSIAARNVGIDPRTARNHMRDANGELTAFGLAVNEAEMEAVDAVEYAQYANALKGNTTSQLNILYNRAPDRWRDMRSVAVSGPGGGPIAIERDRSMLDAVFDRIDDMAARIAGQPRVIDVTEQPAISA